jgi:microsomal dipeptidase-like Zn-dependent dipeptidase
LVHKQLDSLHKFAGDNRDWYEIAMDPWHARQIIHEGKLAVVLSTEVSHLFPTGQGDWRQQLDRLFFKGVRVLQFVHETDSAFSGASHHHGLLFRFLDVLKYPGINQVANLFSGKSSKGLTEKGRELIAEMVKRHMIIDRNHMSARAQKELFEELKRKHKWYPILDSHARFADALPAERLKTQGEYLSTLEQAKWVRQTGGIMGLRTGPESSTPYKERGRTVVADGCPGSATSLVQSVIYGRRAAKVNLAYGTDLNGFVTLTGPRWGSRRCPAGKGGSAGLAPSGLSRTYREKGLASVGQLPDLTADLKALAPRDAANLEDAAENFLRMWERAWDKNRKGPVGD